MKSSTLTYHLALAVVVYSLQTASCFASSAAEVFNLPKAAKKSESKAIPFDKSSKERKENEKGETDTPPKAPSKKRDIPDALVDNPEDFEKPSEERFKDMHIIRGFTDDGLPIIESPTSIDPKDFILTDSESRKKRGAADSGKRQKREPRMDDDDDAQEEEMDILKMLNENARNHHHHHNHDHHQDDFDDIEWDEEKIAAVSDEAANAVLESLGFGKGAGKYWPDGPASTANLIPIAKVRIPFVRRPTL